MADRQTVEGIVMELDSALDSLTEGDVDFESFTEKVEELRDRLKFVLDNTPSG